MTILSQIIADINSLDSASEPIDIYRVIHRLDDYNNFDDGVEIIRYYDSAGVMPTDSAYVGTLLHALDGRAYVLNDAGGSWQVAIGEPDPIVYTFGGTNYGYASGNQTPNNGTIQSYSFVSDGNATNVGTMSAARYNQYGMSSDTHGYDFNGFGPTIQGLIDKFPFASNGTSTSVGNAVTYFYSGASHSTKTYAAGYAHGGQSYQTTVQKLSFASGEAATSLGTIRSNVAYAGNGNQTQEVGYTAGGLTLPAGVNTAVIDKFPFTTETVTSNVGLLTVARRSSFSTSSTEYGYTAGGYTTGYTNIIDKFPFTSDGNATDVGDLTLSSQAGISSSSTTYGYSASSGEPTRLQISKYSFISDGNAISVGNLTAQANHGAQGQQY